MATIENNGSGATPWLALFVGALLVAVAVMGFFMFAGGHIDSGPTMPSQMSVTVKVLPAPNH